ncbi:MAG: hypothetical protein PWR03_2263 [Tenuifilum sp.]|jgi:CheY-like chemotaxis protein|uniref:Response regulator n=1 Tax=Tenuifilum thalassicum TaxID=2590900 RepID=A0A7D3XVT1_9BACT|nr:MULTISPECIES: response regulator [Tenuifilum]MDI3528079.1 hypothetical protein [Tenuifilum sp.]QKG80088.1 response regulator [Tenuifilum thalassicum]
MSSSGYILIVDDSVTNQVLLESILEEEGYKTITVSNIKEAWLRIEKERPRLILLDLLMPNTTGVEFLQEFMASSFAKHIPVFVVSAANTSYYKEKCKALGVNEFFPKPVDIKYLISRVKQVLSNQ